MVPGNDKLVCDIPNSDLDSRIQSEKTEEWKCLWLRFEANIRFLAKNIDTCGRMDVSKIKKPAWEQASPYKPYHHENIFIQTLNARLSFCDIYSTNVRTVFYFTQLSAIFFQTVNKLIIMCL